MTVSYVRSSKRARLYVVVPIEDRFWAKVEKTDGCWLWRGSHDDKGYGQIREAGRGSRLLKAHRLSWTIENGEIQDELNVLHECDNPPCVRPQHLFLGTLADNTQDALAKGRMVFQVHPELYLRGEAVHGAKLTSENVALIRRLRAEGRTLVSLGEQFGVSYQAIAYATNGKTWKHVD